MADVIEFPAPPPHPSTMVIVQINSETVFELPVGPADPMVLMPAPSERDLVTKALAAAVAMFQPLRDVADNDAPTGGRDDG